MAADGWWRENMTAPTAPMGTPLTSDINRLTPDQLWQKCQLEMRQNYDLRRALEEANHLLRAERMRVKEIENFIFTEEGELPDVVRDPVPMLQRMVKDRSVNLFDQQKVVERLVLRILMNKFSQAAAETGQYAVPYWLDALDFEMDPEYPLNDVHQIAYNLAMLKHGSNYR